METDGERLRERQFAERDVGLHRVALALPHHEVLLEHPLHVREAARAAEEAHLRAEVLAPLAAVVAAAACVRRRHRDLVAHVQVEPAGEHARALGLRVGDVTFRLALIAKMLKGIAGGVIVSNLTRPIGVPVVRVTVPGLEMFAIDKERIGDRCKKASVARSAAPPAPAIQLAHAPSP